MVIRNNKRAVNNLKIIEKRTIAQWFLCSFASVLHFCFIKLLFEINQQ